MFIILNVFRILVTDLIPFVSSSFEFRSSPANPSDRAFSTLSGPIPPDRRIFDLSYESGIVFQSKELPEPGVFESKMMYSHV